MRLPPAQVIAAAALLLATLTGCPKKGCPSGETDCGGMCRNLTNDPFNCGACLRICQGGTCNGGSCQCPSGQTLCSDSACHDLQTDSATCGSCGTSCGLGHCSAGACVCDGGAQPCGGNPVCVDTSTDMLYCGSCTTPCTLVNGDCTGGLCGCPATRPTDCSGTCANTNTDMANCGACGTPCTLVNGSCTGGLCGCPPVQPANCSGTCTDTSADGGNCGTCGHTCGSGQTCRTGVCCAPGLPVCQSTCCAGGTGCCPGGGCPVQHDNGVGGSYFSCDPLDNYNAANAQAAALSWNPQSTDQSSTLFCGGSCFAWQTTNACGVWCYTGTFTGKAKVNTISIACLCPDVTSPAWH